MKELFEKIDKEFDEAEGWIRIVDTDWYGDDLRINLAISFCEDSVPEVWEVSCSGVVEDVISSETVDTITVSTESPLIKLYSEPEVDLMFSDNLCAPALLLGVVCSSCVEVLGRAEYVQRFLNQKATVKGIVSSKYGLLGRFPQSISKSIVCALQGQPIRINVLQGTKPKLWTGSEFIDYPELKVLEIGKSYVIGEQFNAIRA